MAERVEIVPAALGWKLLYLVADDEDTPPIVPESEFYPVVAWKITLVARETAVGGLATVTEPITTYEECQNDYLLIGPDGEIIDGIGNRWSSIGEARQHLGYTYSQPVKTAE